MEAMQRAFRCISVAHFIILVAFVLSACTNAHPQPAPMGDMGDMGDMREMVLIFIDRRTGKSSLFTCR